MSYWAWFLVAWLAYNAFIAVWFFDRNKSVIDNCRAILHAITHVRLK